MAKEIDLAGTGQSISFDSLTGFGKSTAMALLSFLFAIGLGSAAVYIYNNFIAPNTPESVGAIDVMTEP